MASRKKELTPAELDLFFSNLELVYRSGLPIAEGFDILRNNAQSAYEKQRLEALYRASVDGASLYDTLAAQGDLPDYALSLIRIGEETGRMEETFASLHAYYAKRDVLTQSIKSSLVYPLSMLVVVLAVVLVLLTQAMPIFDQVFRQLGFEMTGAAAALLDIGMALRSYALVIAVVLIVLILAVVVLRLTPVGKRFFSSLYQSAPITRSLSFNTSAQRHALALSSLLKSGLSVDEALSYAEPLVENKRAKNRIKTIQAEVAAGEPFLTAIERSEIFPPHAMALLSMGFKTGTEADAFEQVGEQISLETEHRLDNLVSIIEPTLVVIMCVLVGIILLAVMLPLVGVLTGF
ncbi:MAG: type II secretion system F family protein [Coriobacteriia bacterium]|nr:type II secretion system F family protein [Coriobacteriia bacterium]